MISQKLLSIFKEKYGPGWIFYWPSVVKSAGNFSLKSAESKAFEFATTILQLAFLFESSKTYLKWDKTGIQTLDQFDEAINTLKQATFHNRKFQIFIINFRKNIENKPEIFSHFSKINGGNEVFEGEYTPTKTLEVFKKEISFLQHANFWLCDWNYSIIVYSAIFYICEYSQKQKKKLSSSFLTIMTNQILFMCETEVEEAMMLVEDKCLRWPQERWVTPFTPDFVVPALEHETEVIFKKVKKN